MHLNGIIPKGGRYWSEKDRKYYEEGEPFLSITVSKNGEASISMKKGLALATKDALSLKGKSVTIESTNGNVDVTTSSGQKFTVNGTNLEVE